MFSSTVLICTAIISILVTSIVFMVSNKIKQRFADVDLMISNIYEAITNAESTMDKNIGLVYAEIKVERNDIVNWAEKQFVSINAEIDHLDNSLEVTDKNLALVEKDIQDQINDLEDSVNEIVNNVNENVNAIDKAFDNADYNFDFILKSVNELKNTEADGDSFDNVYDKLEDMSNEIDSMSSDLDKLRENTDDELQSMGETISELEEANDHNAEAIDSIEEEFGELYENVKNIENGNIIEDDGNGLRINIDDMIRDVIESTSCKCNSAKPKKTKIRD